MTPCLGACATGTSSSQRFPVAGNGVYGRAFARRMAAIGVPVILGTRSPPSATSTAPTWALPCTVTVISEALSSSTVVILAIPHTAAAAFVREHGAGLGGKVLVDVANPVAPSFGTTMRTLWAKAMGKPSATTTASAAAAAIPPPSADDSDDVMVDKAAAVAAADPLASTAERLAAVVAAEGLSSTPVVKAFNNVSAYALDEAAAQTPPPTVMIASEDSDAKAAVGDLARRMGLPVLDAGGLIAARTAEATVHRFFDGWVAAVVVTTILLLACSIYWSQRYFAEGRATTALWYAWLLQPVGHIAMVLLALTFLPGSLAAALQLARGTAKRPFPAWLASWMAIRKQLGMAGWFLATLHAIAGALHGAPKRANDPTYDAYTYIAFGVLAYGAFLLVAMASNPAVASGLSWTEFKTIFSGLGLLTMALTLVHVGVFIKLLSKFVDQFNNPVLPVFLAFGVLSVAAVAMALCKLPPLSIAIKRVRAR